MENEYLSIKEFAEKVGLTPQRIYQMLESDLKPFYKIIESSKMLNSEALKLFDKNLNSNDLKRNSDLTIAVTALRDQLERKDIQIFEKDKQIFELQNLLKSFQEQQLLLAKSLSNSQALHAGTIKEHIEEMPKRKTKSLFSWLFKH